MNDGAEGSEYTSIITSDFKKLLVDAGFDLANSTANSQIQKIPFFAQTNFNIAGGSESDTSLSLIHISEPTRPVVISYAVFCFKKKNFFNDTATTEIYTMTVVGSVRCV